MRNMWPWVVVVAGAVGVGVLLVGRGARSTDHVPASAPGKVPVGAPRGGVTRGLAVGDSLTAHGGYVDVLRQRTGVPWDIAARVGASSTAIVELARTALSQGRHYSHVVVLAGVNDGASSRTTTNLGALYQLARDHGARVVAVAETPWRGYRGGVSPGAWARHQAARQWVLSGGAGLVDAPVDSYQALEDPQRPGALRAEYSSPDHLHLNAAGQRALGTLVADAVLAL